MSNCAEIVRTRPEAPRSEALSRSSVLRPDCLRRGDAGRRQKCGMGLPRDQIATVVS